MSDKISTIIFNNGQNMGLNEAANRCIALASSRYVLFATDDCWFIKPCFKDLCNALSREYIGFICAANDITIPSGRSSLINGTRCGVTGYLGGGITQAFRKDVWKEVGGWDLRSTSGQSDNVFLFKILKSGYFKGAIEGSHRVKCENFENPEGYIPTFTFTKGNDCSLPKLFKMTNQEYLLTNHARRESCQYWVDGERTIPNRHTYDTRPNPVAGLNDIPYWGDYFSKLFSGNSGSCDINDIDWKVAAIHGQDKWKKHILRDQRF
jgi:glycosyltransferase involved in cell wall biosynthesis